MKDNGTFGFLVIISVICFWVWMFGGQDSVIKRVAYIDDPQEIMMGIQMCGYEKVSATNNMDGSFTITAWRNK